MGSNIMKHRVFKNRKTNEIVFEEDAKEYSLEQLGLMKDGKLIVVPMGENGEYTIEQLDNIEQTIEWFYSGDWYEDEIIEDEGNVFELINEENREEY